MSDFDRALPITLRLEGGLSADPVDHGGLTMAGVTQVVYDEYRDLLELPRQSVAVITADEVTALYERLYWEPLDLAHVSWPASLCLFDTAVNMGKAKARAAMGVAFDFSQDPLEQTRLVLAIRLYLYRRTAATDPTQRRFLAGWENRVAALRQETGA